MTPEASAAVRYTVPPRGVPADAGWARSRSINVARCAQVLLIEKVLRAYRHVLDVGHVGLRVGEGELHRLDLQMHAVGGIDGERGHVEVFEDAERDQGHDALTIGRYLVHRVPAVAAGDRPDPVSMMCGKVAGSHGPAVDRRVGFEFGRQFSAVERLAVGRGNRLERGGVIGQT